MNEIQKPTVTIWSAVLPASSANHGLTNRNNRTAAMTPIGTVRRRRVVISISSSTFQKRRPA